MAAAGSGARRPGLGDAMAWLRATLASAIAVAAIPAAAQETGSGARSEAGRAALEAGAKAFAGGKSGHELVGQTVSGQASVLDGNQLVINGQPIFIEGIDAPEPNQTCLDRERRRYPCGERSTEALRKLIRGSDVSCKIVAQDKFRGAVGTCAAGGGDLGQEMVRRGHAVPHGPAGSRFVEDQKLAKKQKRGIWAGEFQLPTLWRRAYGNQPRTFAGQGLCLIKGAVEADGTKRYYRPKEVGYDRVIVDFDKGERFFCSVAEAWDNGWRQPGPTCAVKAKVMADGKKRYFLPEDPEWERTKVNYPKGDRWYCHVGDAVEAGFRRCLIKGKRQPNGKKLYFQADHPKYKEVRVDIDGGDRYFCFIQDAERAGFRLAPR
ncbi:MAG: thermonuclease family protein [Alphaproteobacteria bacterium]|nr:thermonuclease family protein [Alphaproteobacteria bacterium]